MALLEKLIETCSGHNFVKYDSVKQAHFCSHEDHLDRFSTDCWKANVDLFMRMNPDPIMDGYPNDSLAQQIVENLERGNAILTKYVFIAEGLDANGNRAMYTDHTDGIALWDEEALLAWAKTEILKKQLGL